MYALKSCHFGLPLSLIDLNPFVLTFSIIFSYLGRHYLYLIKNETLPPPLPKTTKNVENLGFLAVWDFSLVILHILIFLVLFFKLSSKHFKKIIIINRTNQDRYAVCVVYYHYNHCTEQVSVVTLHVIISILSQNMTDGI